MMSRLFWNNCGSQIDLSRVGYSLELFLSDFLTNSFLKIGMLMNFLNRLITLRADIKILAVVAMIFHILDRLDITDITFVSEKSVFIQILVTFVFFPCVFFL